MSLEALSFLQIFRLLHSTSERNTARNQPVFVSLPFQVLAEIRVGKGNDLLSPFRHALSFQVNHAEFGNHIHYVRARGRHDVAGRQAENDAAAALPSFLIRRRKADERLSL